MLSYLVRIPVLLLSIKSIDEIQNNYVKKYIMYICIYKQKGLSQSDNRSDLRSLF